MRDVWMNERVTCCHVRISLNYLRNNTDCLQFLYFIFLQKNTVNDVIGTVGWTVIRNIIKEISILFPFFIFLVRNCIKKQFLFRNIILWSLS